MGLFKQMRIKNELYIKYYPATEDKVYELNYKYRNQLIEMNNKIAKDFRFRRPYSLARWPYGEDYIFIETIIDMSDKIKECLTVGEIITVDEINMVLDLTKKMKINLKEE